jgi:sulfate adenylyltransferase subunit 2
VAKVQDTIDQGKVVDPGSHGFAQSPPDRDPARRHHRQRLRRRVRRRAPRRGQGSRQGAHPVVPRQFGQWDPRQQRPELWQLYQGKVNPGEHVRAFPLSDWTELDIWQYIERERWTLPSIYFAHERDVVLRDGCGSRSVPS